jgi:hypothetical protein
MFSIVDYFLQASSLRCLISTIVYVFLLLYSSSMSHWRKAYTCFICAAFLFVVSTVLVSAIQFRQCLPAVIIIAIFSFAVFSVFLWTYWEFGDADVDIDTRPLLRSGTIRRDDYPTADKVISAELQRLLQHEEGEQLTARSQQLNIMATTCAVIGGFGATILAQVNIPWPLDGSVSINVIGCFAVASAAMVQHACLWVKTNDSVVALLCLLSDCSFYSRFWQ